jgi:hypothetical protein
MDACTGGRGGIRQRSLSRVPKGKEMTPSVHGGGGRRRHGASWGGRRLMRRKREAVVYLLPPRAHPPLQKAHLELLPSQLHL